MYPKPVEGLSYIQVSENDVNKVLKSLQPNKALGPDGLPTKILVECADSISGSISELFNSSLETGSVPSKWKCANVAPIYKKGEVDCPANYRPLSLFASNIKGLGTNYL